MTGTTLFTISRLFSAWETRGLVRPRRKAVTICDLQALCTIAKETRKGPKPIRADAAERLREEARQRLAEHQAATGHR
jgi:hypothetical protein